VRIEKATLAALIAGTGAAFVASACCVLPLALVAAGVGGAWLSTLAALEPYRPLFIGITVLCVGFAFHRLYLSPAACAPGGACADPATRRRHRLVFWSAAAAFALLLAVPYAPGLA
jgi:mercuric ion transport protein